MKLMDPYWFLNIDLKDGEMKHQCEKKVSLFPLAI